MDWFLKYDIARRAEKQVDNIDFLINHQKYLLARREIIKFLNQFPNFWELNQRMIIVNHRLNLDAENIEYLQNVLKVNDASGVKSFLFETYYYLYYFEKAFDLLEDFMDSAREYKLKNYRIYEVILMKKLGMNITLFDFEQDNYVLKQIVNYDKELFLNQTRKQFKFYKDKKYSFSPNFDLDLLCNTIFDNISHYQKSKELSCFDVYHINYPNVIWDEDGIEKKEILVKTIPDSNEIITIQPVTGKHIDILNNLVIEKEFVYKSPYQKQRKSQIDKFYSRYNM